MILLAGLTKCSTSVLDRHTWQIFFNVTKSRNQAEISGHIERHYLFTKLVVLLLFCVPREFLCLLSCICQWDCFKWNTYLNTECWRTSLLENLKLNTISRHPHKKLDFQKCERNAVPFNHYVQFRFFDSYKFNSQTKCTFDLYIIDDYC